MRKYVGMLLVATLLTGCGNEQEAENKPEEAETEETGEQASVTFKNVVVKVEDELIHLTGEAKTNNSEIYYELIQDEKVLKKETVIHLEEGHLNWSEFVIDTPLPTGDVSDKEQPPIFVLYVKVAGGKVVNPNYIPVDI